MSDTATPPLDAARENSPIRDEGRSADACAAPDHSAVEDAAAHPINAANTPPNAEPNAADPPQTKLGMLRSDTYFALIAGGGVVVLMLVHWAQLTWRGQPRVEIDRLESRAYEFQLEINRATWVEWMQLENIGETLARRIVEDREQHGPFRSAEELTRVKGIGPKTLDGIRHHLRCSDCPPSSFNETSP